MFVRKNCSINLYSDTEPFKVTKISIDKFNLQFSFYFHNQTHFLAWHRNLTSSYFVPSLSILNCFSYLFNNRHLKNVTQEKNREYSGKSLIEQNEMGPVLYVIGVLSIFSLIFILILLLTNRYNKQNEELIESRMIMKRWKEQLKSSFKYKSKKSSSECDQMKRLSCLNLYSKNCNISKKTSRRFVKKKSLASKLTSELIIPRFESENFDFNYGLTPIDFSKSIHEKLSWFSVKTV
ncbi:hypothetical protein BpHYR1_030427 [Brachionus plicatilis]|uniref:Uncharacterized protein n=1 Tax=Brachionus plicatilis TaxID=10195 RepID=A0A3M7PQ14_BRAPC|nr:hypothetical protein BpHYR1_030427 [Brachionus plicatilis]